MLYNCLYNYRSRTAKNVEYVKNLVRMNPGHPMQALRWDRSNFKRIFMLRDGAEDAASEAQANRELNNFVMTRSSTDNNEDENDD